MLMALGPVVFDLRTNLQGIKTSEETSLAEHPVIGAAPIYEVTGDGKSSITLEGVIYPEFSGGIAGLTALTVAREQRVPLPLTRGTLSPMGWFYIQSLQREEAELNQAGVGREIKFTASLLSAGPASGFSGAGGGLISQIIRLLAS